MAARLEPARSPVAPKVEAARVYDDEGPGRRGQRRWLWKVVAPAQISLLLVVRQEQARFGRVAPAVVGRIGLQAPVNLQRQRRLQLLERPPVARHVSYPVAYIHQRSRSRRLVARRAVVPDDGHLPLGASDRQVAGALKEPAQL
eukprot:6772770-Prymnesium_polylepis.3